MVMRPTKWGNRYRCPEHGSLVEVIAKYKIHLLRRLKNSDRLRKDLRSLADKRLVCCCAPDLCHADVLAELAVMDDEELQEQIDKFL